jgi:hypothetical protein
VLVLTMTDDALRKFFSLEPRVDDRCADCGGRITRDHHDKTLDHMGVRISACEDRRISQDGA